MKEWKQEICHKLFAWLGYGKRLAVLVTIFQLLAGVFAYLHSAGYWKRFAAHGFLIFAGMVLLLLVGRLISLHRRSAIVFRLHRRSGVLEDQLAHFRNVALRKDTWETIITSFYKKCESTNSGQRAKEALHDTGLAVGLDFTNKVLHHWNTTGQDISTACKAVNLWFQYDSSSGMGKFEIEEGTWLDKPYVNFIMRIKNPFTYSMRAPDTAEFMRGYIKGVLDGLLEGDSKVTLLSREADEAGQFYRFEVNCIVNS